MSSDDYYWEGHCEKCGRLAYLEYEPDLDLELCSDCLNEVEATTHE